ncbi:MAG: FecR family protein [Paludibacteraceae bacterium]
MKKGKMNQDNYWEKLLWVRNILKRYMNDELNPEEEQIVSNWNPDGMIPPLQQVKLSKKQIEKHGEKVRQNVLLACDIERDRSQKRVGFPLSIRKYAAVAAMFVFVAAISYFMLFDSNPPIKTNYSTNRINKTTILQTAFSGTRELTLSDGTKLYVNGGTRIEYDKKQFNKNKREIWLSGEAFFEVAKNPDKPFIIHTGGIQTVVRGTSFNIKAYDEIGEISVSVRTGKVEVGTGGETFGLLTQNKQLVFNEKTNEHAITESPWEDAGAWMDKRLVLKDASVNELKLRLKQLYDVTLVDKENLLEKSLLNASYGKGASLDNVLSGIGEAYGISYSFDATSKTISLHR